MKKSDTLKGRCVTMKGTAAYGYIVTPADVDGQVRVVWDAAGSSYIHHRKLELAERQDMDE